MVFTTLMPLASTIWMLKLEGATTRRFLTCTHASPR